MQLRRPMDPRPVKSPLRLTVFAVSLLDRIHAWIFALILATQLALVVALVRRHDIAWLAYTQLAMLWYPLMTLDGIYVACQTGVKLKQECNGTSATRRLVFTLAALIFESIILLVLLILGLSGDGATALLREQRLGFFIVVAVTQAVLAVLTALHVWAQWLYSPGEGQLLHARLNQ